MVRNKKIIIAIGGGGFTHSSDKDLDEDGYKSCDVACPCCSLYSKTHTRDEDHTKEEVEYNCG